MKKPGGDATRWTLIRRAQGHGADASAALGELLTRYERTVVQLIRSLQTRWRWHPPTHTPDDLKQELMAELLRRGDIHKLDRTRGSFRGWLHVTVRNFTSRQRRQWLAPKGGNATTVAGEFEIVHEATPEVAYIRSFIADLLCDVLAQLDSMNENKPRYRDLRRFLPGPQMDPVELNALAQTLGMTPNSLAVAIHTLRAQYKKVLFEAVADTLELDPDPDGSPPSGAAARAVVQRELRELYAALLEVPTTQVRVDKSE